MSVWRRLGYGWRDLMAKVRVNPQYLAAILFPDLDVQIETVSINLEGDLVFEITGTDVLGVESVDCVITSRRVSLGPYGDVRELKTELVATKSTIGGVS